MEQEGEDGPPVITEAGSQILVTVNVNSRLITIAKRNLEVFDTQDPYFFDSDYTIAGSTGFLLWEANWLLLRLMRGPLRPLLAGRRVLDLGSGTGLAGLAAAAGTGAHVLLTDLASVCSGLLRQNVQRNATAGPAAAAAAGAAAVGVDGPGWVQQGLGGYGGGAAGGPWPGAVAVGAGSAAVMALDWTEPLGPQVAAAGGTDPRDADVILAVDTIWLRDIFTCFMDLVVSVLTHGRQQLGHSEQPGPRHAEQQDEQRQQQDVQVQGAFERAAYVAFVERASADSVLFVKKEEVEAGFRGRGCRVDVVLAEDVDVDGVKRPGRVLRVTCPRSQPE